MTVPIQTLTREMLREEWRFHERVVGSRAFLIFPVMFGLVAACLLAGGQYFDIALPRMVQVAHLFVLIIGLHMGNIALTGRDAIDNLMGGVTFLVYTSRTMPVSTERLVCVFLLKNAIYYTGMLTLPLAASFLLVTDPTTVLSLLAALTGTYLWGLVAALLGVNIVAHGTRAKAITLLAIAALVAVWLLDFAALSQYTPYALYADPGLTAVASCLLPLGGAAVLGVRFFSPTVDEDLRVVNDSFKAWADVLPSRHSAVAAKALLGLNRSNGGLVKFVISTSLIFAVCSYLFTLLSVYTPSGPFMGIAMGGFLGLEAVLSFLWLVRFDAFDEYAFLPMDAGRLVWGKVFAFCIAGVPLALIHYVFALLVLDITALDAALGLLVLGGLLMYFFGVPLVLAKFSPHENLLHPLRFLILATALYLPLAGIFALAFTVPTLTTTVIAATVAFAGVAFGVGVGCVQYAAMRWEVNSQ